MLGTTRPESAAPTVPTAATDPLTTGPFDRARPRVFVSVAVAVVTNIGSLGAARGQSYTSGPDLIGVLLLLVAPAVLVFLLPRRPALATTLSVASTLTFLLLGYPWGPVFLGPAAVLVGVMLSGEARRARLIAWSGAALLVGGFAASATLLAPRIERLVRDEPPTRPRDGGHGPWSGGPDWGGGDGTWFLDLGSLAAGAAWLAVLLLIASAARDRAARKAAARTAAQETAAERERTAVASERLRIARELHDVLAHSLSAINVQAGVGLHLIEKNPGQARDALANIRDTSKEALVEVRTVLGIVRAGSSAPDPGTLPGDSVPLAPTWDRTALRRLADQARADGIDVVVNLSPRLAELPDHLAGVVHRVVQESLTNVRRHAPSARQVVLTVGWGETVEVVVSDDGVASPGPTGPAGPDEPGYGLLGMRERVEGAGGSLVAGPRAAGAGWEVRATLPAPAPPGAPGPTDEPTNADDTPETGETA